MKSSLADCENAVSLLAEPKVESLNPGKVNKINCVSKFSSICKGSFPIEKAAKLGNLAFRGGGRGVIKKSKKSQVSVGKSYKIRWGVLVGNQKSPIQKVPFRTSFLQTSGIVSNLSEHVPTK